MPGSVRFTPRKVTVQDQFGTRDLLVKEPMNLCVPSEKDGVPSDLNIDDFKCYRVRRRLADRVDVEVEIEDQLESRRMKAIKPYLFCNPVDKNDEGILVPEDHLTCYLLRDREPRLGFLDGSFQIRNQLDEQSVRLTSRRLVCLPGTKIAPLVGLGLFEHP